MRSYVKGVNIFPNQHVTETLPEDQALIGGYYIDFDGGMNTWTLLN